MSAERRAIILAAMAVAAIGAACARATSPDSGPLEASPGWVEVPGSPLSPRFGSHAFWVGKEILVLGGSASDPCPPTAACLPPSELPLRDGAALDPETGTWRTIAPAPVPLGWASGAVQGDVLYIWVPADEDIPGMRRAFVSYDVESDRWEELPMPPVGGDRTYVLAPAEDRIVAYQSTQGFDVMPDLEFDPSTRTWSELPTDPLVPSFDRTMVWTEAGLALLGIENVPQPGSEGPAVYRAAVLDLETRSWRRLPDSEISGYDPSWFWAGGLLVNPTLGTSDGGEVNNWGRPYPHGGILDPAQGMWSPLPDPPEPGDDFPSFAVGGAEYVSSFSSWVLHVSSGRWFELPPPPDSAHEGQAVTWAGDRLFVWGGVRWDGNEPTILGDGWLWSAP
jgi:hypothetical protein